MSGKDRFQVSGVSFAKRRAHAVLLTVHCSLFTAYGLVPTPGPQRLRGEPHGSLKTLIALYGIQYLAPVSRYPVGTEGPFQSVLHEFHHRSIKLF
jgi:hypothetical protein